jgi:hypothetical protein
MINTGVFKPLVNPGSAFTREVFILDENGNVIGTEILESQHVILLHSIRGEVNFTSTSIVPILERISMNIHYSANSSVHAALFYFSWRLNLKMQFRRDFNSIISLAMPFTAIFTQDFEGIRSNSQYLSANMMFTLQPIRGELKMKVN